MTTKKVSVIILTYNHCRYINQAVESVLNQETSFPIEVIITDDNSNDCTKTILQSYKKKYPNLIKLILRKENVGTTKNICDAFKISTGEYITAFGGDDYWIDNQKLQIQANWLDNHPDFFGISHVTQYLDDAGSSFGTFPETILIGKTASKKLFSKGIYFRPSDTMYRNFYKDEKTESYFSLITSSRLIEDISLEMILLAKGKIYVMDRCMAVYRKNYGTNNSNYNSIRNPIQNFEDHIEVFIANEKFFNNEFNLAKLYANKAASALTWSIKNNKFHLFCIQMKRISIKTKVLIMLNLPLILLKGKYKKILFNH